MRNDPATVGRLGGGATASSPILPDSPSIPEPKVGDKFDRGSGV